MQQLMNWNKCHMPRCPGGAPTLIRLGVANDLPICFEHAKQEVIHNPSEEYKEYRARPVRAPRAPAASAT